MTIIEKLQDLLIQATKERSHHYVASVVKEAIAEIEGHHAALTDMEREDGDLLIDRYKENFALSRENKRLEQWIDDLQSGMYINCVYCGHRYGPNDGVYTPMRKVLERHIESCPKHPLRAAKAEIEQLDYLHNLDHSLADQWQQKNESLSAKMRAYFTAAEFGNVDGLMQESEVFFRQLGLSVAERTKALARKK